MIYRYEEGMDSSKFGIYITNRPILGFIIKIPNVIYFRFRWGHPKASLNYTFVLQLL